MYKSPQAKTAVKRMLFDGQPVHAGPSDIFNQSVMLSSRPNRPIAVRASHSTTRGHTAKLHADSASTSVLTLFGKAYYARVG